MLHLLLRTVFDFFFFILSNSISFFQRFFFEIMNQHRIAINSVIENAKKNFDSKFDRKKNHDDQNIQH